MSVVMRIVKDWLNLRGNKRTPRIAKTKLTSDGFIVQNDDDSTEKMVWLEIEQIFTYKVDCFTYDLISLGFVKQDGQIMLQISEDSEEFADLMLAMNKAFPSIDQAWYQKVMLPAFAKNMTILLERPVQD